MTAQDYLLSGGTPVFYSGNSENLVWCYTFNGVDENLQCYDVSVGKGMLDVSNYDNIPSGLTKLTGYNKIKLPDGNIYGLGFNNMLFGSEQEEVAPKSSTNSITNQQTTKYSGLIYYSGSTQFVDKLNYTTYQDTGGTSASLILVGENDDYSFSNEGSLKAPSYVPAVEGNYLFVIPCNNVLNPSVYIGTFLGKDLNDFIALMSGGTSIDPIGPFE